MEDLLQNIIRRQKVEIGVLLRGPLLGRIQSKRLTESLSSNLIKVITGPRRAGKSTLALQALEGRSFAYINLEDESLPTLEDGDLLVSALDKIYGAVDFYLFDEIQNFERWPQFLNRLQRLGKNVIATGSNSRLLGEELVSSLTGRHVEIEVLPLSFREGYDCSPDKISEYLSLGGYPEVILNKNNFQSYLSALWDAVILKDIAKRKRVRNLSGLSDVMSLFLSSITSRYSMDSFARALNQSVTAPTIKSFINYGIEAYLISELTLYNHKPRKRIKSDRKAYVIDNGFYAAKNFAFSPNLGVLLENAVYKELRIRGFKPNLNLFYYLTKSGFEIDFLLRDGAKNIQAIQVCYSLSGLKTKERELRALTEASKELNVSDLTIITLDESRIENFESLKINVISAYDWFTTNL